MRKLMWFSMGFAISCALCAYFSLPWTLSLGFLAAGVAAVLHLLRKNRVLRIASAVVLGISVGFMMFFAYERTVLADAKELDGKTERATLVIRDYSYETNYGSAADATIYIGKRGYKVRVYLDEDMHLEPGNRVIGTFSFEKTTGDGVDEVLYHRGQGIFLVASQEDNVIVERCYSVPWRDYPAVWRQELKQRLDEAFDSECAAFAKGLLLGDRTDLGYETETDFKVSGITHIIAVSGLHVSILFGLIYMISGKNRLLTTALGVPVVLIFAAIAGFTPSITRAAVMQILMMTAMLLGREYDPPTALAFSALMMLIWNPLVITSVSFQLSFSCMAGIVLFSEPLAEWMRERLGKGKIAGWLSSSISVSLSACVFTTPLVALYFGTVSLIGPLTNLLTLWVITFIFYGLMAVCLLSIWSAALASAAAAVIAWPIRYVLKVSQVLASFPLAAVYVKSPYIVIWLVMAYVLLGIYLCLKQKPAAMFAAVTLGGLCLALALSWAEPLADDFRATVLDVGQGQAILLQSEGKTFLVDCGSDYGEDAADITAETLLSQGISKLDGIIMTHYDRDHSGGIGYLLTRIDADRIYLPFCTDENGVGEQLRGIVGDSAVIVREDTDLTWGGAKISLFVPVSYNSGNESSMSVLFRTEKCAILITGDMGEDGERLLMKYHALPDVDVLVAGHHGSKYSTSQALLEAVKPEYVLISVGDNRYGHPAQVILDRLAEFGCIVLRTDEYGTIIYKG